MSEAIYLTRQGQPLVRMELQDYQREEDFQQLLQDFPELLAGEQIDNVVPRRWLFVAREAAIPAEADSPDRWSLDHLFLDQDAVPTLVEVKRKTDTRLRREVVGQMLDYAANAVVYWPADTLRSQFTNSRIARDEDPEEILRLFLGDEGDPQSYWQTAQANLREGKVRLVFVADRIPRELQRIVEFLNERMSPTEVLALEIRRYAGEGLTTHIPRIIGQTSEAQLTKRTGGRTTTSRRKWDEGSFMDDVRRRLSEAEADAVRKMVDFGKNSAQITWGTGNDRGSVNPKFPDIATAAPFTLYSDGTLQIKLTWFQEQREFCELLRSELAREGLPSEAAQGRDPEIAVSEWMKWKDRFLSAVSAAVSSYRSKEKQAENEEQLS
jgi:hypothetical protein